MMVGLQGSGKTTSTAKIARRLKEKERKKVLMASLDVQRPAAQEQLAVLGTQTDVATLPIVPGQQPVDIAKRALQAARSEEHTSELQSLMRISYAVFCLKKKTRNHKNDQR